MGFALDSPSELLSVRIDGLAGSSSDIVSDFAPILTIKSYSLDKELMLFFRPVPFSLTALMLNMRVSFLLTLLTLGLSLLISPPQHLSGKLFFQISIRSLILFT